jgi:hypothetical protein
MALEIRKEDIRQESVNTTPDQFKVIDDVKDEPTLKEAQDFVGGIVEGIQFPNGDYMIINEEGKLINLPLNVEATALWRNIYIYNNTRIGCAPPAGRASSVAPSALRASGRASIEVPHHFGNPNYSNTLI